MADIVTLIPSESSPEGFKRAVNGDVVERLRDLLRRAESGELTGCIVCFVQSDGSIGHNWSRSESTAAMLASVALAQASYARHLMVDLAEETE